MATFKRTDEHYVAGSLTLPQEYYTSAEVFAREVERIFKSGWYCAGHASRIAEPGQYFLHDLSNESIIVVRDRQGGIRAFYNVCRHRGTRICERGGTGASIQCSIAWTCGWMAEDQRAIHEGCAGRLGGVSFATPVHVWEASSSSPGLGRRPHSRSTAPLLRRFGLESEQRKPLRIAVKSTIHRQNFNSATMPTIHPLLNGSRTTSAATI
jgi:hypothetical protein